MAKKRNSRNRAPGLYLRGASWWMDVRVEGRRYQRLLGKNISKTIAKERYDVERGKIIQGEFKKKKRDLSFKDAKSLFLEWAQTDLRPRTVEFYEECLGKLEEDFGKKRMSEISTFQVQKYKKKRKDEGAEVRANRELATLKALYNRLGMVKDGALKRYDGPNPVTGIKMFKETGKLRFLSHEEEKRLLAACGEPLRTLVIVGIYSGMRVASEILKLRWGSVDFRERTITAEAAYAKNHESRVIPMNSFVVETLMAHKKTASRTKTDDNVFLQWKGPRAGEPLASIRTAFATACRKAEVFNLTPHDLRHSFATRLVASGVDLITVQALAGWKEISMVQRYAHPSDPHKADAVERMLEQKQGQAAGQPRDSLRFSLHGEKQSS